MNLQSLFSDRSRCLPVKINFYIQKNKSILYNLAQDIEEARLGILKYYGVLNEETNEYEFEKEKAEMASKELEDLFNLTQEVEIYTIDIDAFDNDTNMTIGEIDALMFMII
jgi:hypothetical protein